MRDTLIQKTAGRTVGTEAKARSLHALGAFYLRQGFPRQGLSLLLAARDYGIQDDALDRAIAQAYLLSGAPKKTLEILDGIESSLSDKELRDSARTLRSRALLALGRVEDARRIFATTGASGGRA